MVGHEKEFGKLGRSANKLNRIARATVDMTREVSEGASLCMTKSMLPWNLEGEVTT